MIVVNISGGLGNQMFQFACGIAISAATKQKVVYSTDGMGDYAQKWPLGLKSAFDIDVPTASKSDLERVLGVLWSRPYMRRIFASRFMRIFRPQYFIAEENFNYIDDLTQRVSNQSYLHGYWQTELYFSDYSDLIREKFCFIPDADERNATIIKDMEDVASIGIHVRRGDYITNSKAASLHGVLPAEYYIGSICQLREKFPHAPVYVFSDDQAWVKENLNIKVKDIIMISHNTGANSFRDMQLMTHCQALVIANSSFSWWGAWLNKNLKKEIIAPRNWFVDTRLKQDRIVPQSWIRR